MCGIVGIIDYYKQTPLNRDIQRMLDIQAHRGPDSEGTYINSDLGIALGASRLSILDLNLRASMPMSTVDKKNVLVYNGEIYNFLTLKSQLKSKYEFRTTSDTEVLLYHLLNKGTVGVEDLDGMFAFAYFKVDSGELILGRDRVGIKPLYYYEDEQLFLFASEVKSIWAVLGNKLKLSQRAFWDVLTQGYNYGTSTLFQNIKVLTPGNLLRIKIADRTIKTINYHDILDNIQVERHDYFNTLPEASIKNRLLNSLKESVKAHTISDAPVGVVCSGGVDSSLLSVLANQYHQGINLYHAEIQGSASELKYAQAVGKTINRPVYAVQINKENFITNWVDTVFHSDFPSYHPNDIPMYLVCKLAREYNNKVLISGEGADELFGGYRVNLELQQKHKIRKWIERLP
ncbi:MAG: asparagine synthase (glutamine-hydrolyzing) [Saprospiraceae bacterium]|nr:asparagine synthase (glutamine-hydrolyzing) [Saprospiraceae bacterium]